MDLARLISRRPAFRVTVAAIHVASALVGAIILAVLGAPLALTVGLPILIAVCGAAVLAAPTDTMDERWFHVLPVAVVLLATAAMWASVPDPGPVAVVFVFVGALIAYSVSALRDVVGHLVLATALLVSPVVAGQSEVVSTLTILAAAVGMWTLAATMRAVTVVAEEATAKLDDLARHDALTGLVNRTIFAERLNDELARAGASGQPLALVLLDLNGFKRVNDAQGHAAGDELLRRVARALEEVVRGEDLVSRHGGDEFCVLAPETDAEGAAGLVRRMREALAGLDAAGRPVRAGIGVALAPQDGRTARKLFEAADAAAMRDKRGERGLVDAA